GRRTSCSPNRKAFQKNISPISATSSKAAEKPTSIVRVVTQQKKSTSSNTLSTLQPGVSPTRKTNTEQPKRLQRLSKEHAVAVKKATIAAPKIITTEQEDDTQRALLRETLHLARNDLTEENYFLLLDFFLSSSCRSVRDRGCELSDRPNLYHRWSHVFYEDDM
ncbi:unnamed protein product, partial [Amoebophrya sp. A25]